MVRTTRNCTRWIELILLCVTMNSTHAAQPITINFEDIFNKPFDQNVLPPFTWKGVRFEGGALRRTDAAGTYYTVRGRSAIQLTFPAGSTEISFKASGYGQTIFLPDKMPIDIWKGAARTGTLVTTLPYPGSTTGLAPPTNLVEIPGSGSVITLFSAPAPSGIEEVSNEITIDDIRYTPPDPEPTITFDAVLPQHTRVLTHNYGAYPYPSVLQTQDGSIRINATAYVNGQPAPSKTIYFRVIDPPDTADYVVHAGDASFGDNFDGPGKLNGQTAASAVSDGAGRVSVTLNVTSFAAGDNYQIEASGNANFPCGLSCAKSATYTAWKRIYVEYNKMFRRGAYLVDDALAGANALEVDDVRSLPNPPFRIRLLHAAPVNAANGDFATTETALVLDVDEEPSSIFNNKPIRGRLVLDAKAGGLSRDYSGPEVVLGVQRTYLADAVGVITGTRATDFLLANGTLVNDLMDGAFTEYVWLTDSIAGEHDLLFTQPTLDYDGVIPRQIVLGGQNLDEEQREWITRKWLQHATRQGVERTAISNHQSLFTTGAFYHSPNAEAFLGLTTSASGFSDTWLAIVDTGNQNRIAEATSHELSHQWLVNHGGTNPHTDGGHCGAIAGIASLPANTAIHMVGSSTRFCVMTADIFNFPEAGDGTINFHHQKFGGVVDSEYLRIRRRAEPMPQNDATRTQPK